MLLLRALFQQYLFSNADTGALLYVHIILIMYKLFYRFIGINCINYILIIIVYIEGWKRKSSNWHFSSNPHFYIFVITILSYISLLNIKTQFCKKMYETKICPNALCATLSFCWKRKSSMCNAKILKNIFLQNHITLSFQI